MPVVKSIVAHTSMFTMKLMMSVNHTRPPVFLSTHSLKGNSSSAMSTTAMPSAGYGHSHHSHSCACVKS